MPATRRKSGAPTGASSQSSQQSTLSFNNKPSRITKANTVVPSKKSKLSEPASNAITSISTPEPEEVIETSDVIIQPSPAKPSTPKRKTKRKSDALDPVREKAAKVSDAQIRKYWKAEEDARLAPRVHQQSVPLHEKILRHFDLSSQYGPCIGIERLRRWERASTLDLDPPIEVLAVLLREEAMGEKRETGKIAYIDELGGGRKVLVD